MNHNSLTTTRLVTNGHSLICITCLLLTFFLSGCDKKAPVRIGFVGGLSDRSVALGGAGRDGILLAVEEVNDSGGIGGRQIDLLVGNDKQDPDQAQRVVQRMLDSEVSAIVGPMTSSMALAVVPMINKAQTVMLSPTTSTDSLNNLDDYFFRIYPSNKTAASLLAKHVYSSLNLPRMAVIYDIKNREHSETWFHNFKAAYETLGGEVVNVETFTSGASDSFRELAKRSVKIPLDGLLIIANSVDTAFFCQQLACLNINIPLFASEWSTSNELISLGGKTVEGMKFFRTFDENAQFPRYRTFAERFRLRFGRDPDFAAVHAYDAAHIIFTALQKRNKDESLKQSLLKQKVFKGVQGKNLTLDEYGDIERELYFMEIRNESFISL